MGNSEAAAAGEGRHAARRGRLVDHFKRVYTIIAGLAITEACRRLLPFSFDSLPGPSFWMFCTFFVTLVPIFQGGDRSLDIKYLDDLSTGPPSRWSYIWDVYVLLITAILFVCTAEAIPLSIPLTGANPANPAHFYYWMAIVLGFDVIALVADLLKSHVRSKLKSYGLWIVLNAILCAICLIVGLLLNHANATISLIFVSFVVFVLALARTIFDYAKSDDFMFPR